MKKLIYILLPAVLLSVACRPDIYVRDGVTDGDSFYLAPQAYNDNDPVLQSWVTYSLLRSACQLETGSENPARVSTYNCELKARQHLLEAWQGKPHSEDEYLDTLLDVRHAGFLEEYTVYYFGKQVWQVPDTVDMDAFDNWRRVHLKRHRPETRLIGSWGYAGALGEGVGH
ncbi:MAG: hypothetical protein HKN06_04530 [Gammaproteobacteria bacterium]|nr:hypothetical protein [Gammaproteobacteria bacterium]